MLAQWHVKDPGHSAKSAGGRLHLNMHTPLTQRSQSGADCAAGNSSGNTWLQLSQLDEPLWMDPALKSGISVRELLSKKKKKEKKKGSGRE